MQNKGVNHNLIGHSGSALHLQTPALVLDINSFERNVQSMALHCKHKGLTLRPHSKTHKCVEIARRQIAAGAVGVCCAKLGEAEVMVAGGVESVLITSPVVSNAAIERLCALNNQATELIVVVDNPVNVEALIKRVGDKSAEQAKKPLKVLVDIDPDLHRTGIAAGQPALDLVQRILATPHLEFMGLQIYAGQVMHIESYAERQKRSLVVMKLLDEMRVLLKEKGINCAILSGGGTGTFDIDAAAGVLNELQAGSYIVMDREYNEIDREPPEQPGFETGLFVQMSVVSNNTAGLLTVDAGFKSFATDADTPLLCWAQPGCELDVNNASYFFFGDEHGGIKTKKDVIVDLGTPMRAVVPHCDPTINLYDYIHVIQGDKLVDIWTVDARGKSA